MRTLPSIPTMRQLEQVDGGEVSISQNSETITIKGDFTSVQLREFADAYDKIKKPKKDKDK